MRSAAAAAATPHGPYEDPGDPVGEVRVAWNDPLLSLNNNTIHANALAITNVRYLMDAGVHATSMPTCNLINNDQFGTCTIDSLDPLTITYRINEGVTWTDGVQVDAADLLLFWASQSTVYNDENTVTTPEGVAAEGDENGSPIVDRPRRRGDHVGRRGGVRRGVRSRDRCAARGLHATRKRPAWRSTPSTPSTSWPPSCR